MHFDSKAIDTAYFGSQKTNQLVLASSAKSGLLDPISQANLESQYAFAHELW